MKFKKRHQPRSFFVNDFQKMVWNDNYQDQNETIEHTQQRLVSTIYKDDSNDIQNDAFKSLMSRRLFFGGRVTANTGTGVKNVHSFNCYAAQRATKPVDSIKNIFTDVLNAAEILKTEGGIGFNFNHIRPKGTLIKGVGVGTPGVVAFMEIYDKSAEIITRGTSEDVIQRQNAPLKKKIRKGAQMSMLSIVHPEAIEYIKAKSIPNMLTKFNMSVIITDAFMKKLENKENWDFWFPDIHFDKYDAEWDGDFDTWEAKGYPKVVYKTMPAKEVWDFLIENMYKRNEPGLYFIDNANRFNNLLHFQKITGTNPCGEINMLADGGVYEKNGIIYEYLGDICNLGSLNLCEFVDQFYFKDNLLPNKFNLFDYNEGFDWDKFADDTKLLIRGLDNLIDISGYPFEKLKTAAMLRRKIGAGIFGYGSALMMMGMKYGSNEAIRFTEHLMTVFANVAYQTSAELAHEKGSFILYDDEVINQGFIKNSGILTDATKDLIRKYGLRNSQCLTVAPTGNLSIYAGCISGGVEPVFELDYFRWAIINHRTKATLKDLQYPRFEKGEFFETKDFKFEMRGDDQILISRCGNFMIDQNRGLTEKIPIQDYAYKTIVDNYSEEVYYNYKERGVFTCAMDLTADEHLNPFITLSKHIDNSISKTVNLPNDYPIEDFDQLYQKLWREGGRGITTYRDGTMMAVLETKKEGDKQKPSIKKEQKDFFKEWKDHERGEVVPHQVNLPSEYPMKGKKISSEGKKWYVSLSFKDKKMERPFAIFVTTNNNESNITTFGTIESLNELAESEGIALEHIEDNDKKCSGHNNVNKIARTISLLLRHNVKIEKIVKVLDSLEIPISSLVYRLKKLLMEYVFTMTNGKKCPICDEKMIFTEGCVKCSLCDYSQC